MLVGLIISSAMGFGLNRKQAEKIAPTIGTFGIVIMACNVSSLFKLSPPAKNITFPVALAIVAIIYVIGVSISMVGIKGFWSSLIHPMPAMLPFKLLDYIIKPVSLSLRLFGNVFGAFVFMEFLDVCIANEEDAGDVFGIKAENTDITGGKLNHEGYKSVAKQLADRFGFEKVAITLRSSISANDNDWAAMLYDGTDYYFSKSYHIHIVDRVGGGDSFGAGLIYASLTEMSAQQSIEFAVAASCLKHSVEGDFNMVTVPEVMALAGGDGSGRVQR